MRVPSLLASLVLLVGAASAQMFPAVPKTGTVYDGAGLLSAKDEAGIDALSRDVQHKTGAPLVVATLPSLTSVGAKAMGIERYAAALFDQWRIGSKRTNRGVLLVVAKADRKARIEFGKDWRHTGDDPAHTIMQGTIVPAFKRGDFSGGIVKGCQALAHLAETPKTLPSTPSTTSSLPPPSYVLMGDPPVAPSFDMEPSFPFGGLICFAIPILGFIAIVASIRKGLRGGYGSNRMYGNRFGSGPIYQDRFRDSNDDAFTAGVIAGQAMSPPTYDPGPSSDSSSAFDSGSSSCSSGSSDSGGSFDSGSSGGGGDTGSW